MHSNNELKDYIGGPRTTEGKANSAQNSTKHGLCSNTVRLLNSENIEDFQALQLTWFNTYQPSDDAETRLVLQLIDADFLLERANKAVAHVEAQLFESADPLHWTEDQHLKLTRMNRYQTARANAVIKCRKAIEDYRRNRQREDAHSKKQSATPTQKKQETLKSYYY